VHQSRRWQFLLSLLLVLALVSPALAFHYYLPSPRGSIGLSRPIISQQFVLGEGERFEWARMWLDGVEVLPVTTDNATGLVSYTPPTPLAAGTHQVKLDVRVSHPKQGFYYNTLTHEFSFTVAAGAVSVLPDPSAEALQALAHLNRLRQHAGLPSMSISAALCAAATGHASYQAALGQLTHSQDPGRALFFGADVMARAMYYVYTGGVAEVIAGNVTTIEAIDGWLATPYHRLPLIDPRNVDLGYGAASGSKIDVSVAKMGPVAGAGQRVAWPYPGQTDVPVSWSGREIPDPFRLYPGVKGPVGYTVSLTFEKQPSVTLTEASLSTGGASVAVMRFSPGIDEYLDSTVALIPYSPLAAGKTYDVHFTGTVNFGQGPVAYDERWSFTTAGGVAPPPGTSFVDVPSDHPAAGAIAHLVLAGVLNGYPDGTFRPAAQITRAEFAKMMVVASGWLFGPGEPAPFADTAGHWAAQMGYLQAIVRAGAINGFPDGTFRPQDPVTRAQATKTAAAACGIVEEPLPPGGGPYSDLHAGLWYAGWVSASHRSGLIGGLGRWPLWTGSVFGGDVPLTRAEAALLISNYMFVQP
jgi:uncharacterized protein YkwD